MRQKPDHKKRQYAFGVSLGITLVIFGFWMAGKRPANDTMAVKKADAPVKALTASVADAYGSIKDVIFGKNMTEYSSNQIDVEVLPGKI